MISARGAATTAVVAAMVLLAAGAVQAITIDTVPVGNPGNVADDTGYGAVAYTYNMGKYEVTAGQYTAFLNAVAATDTYGLYNTLMADLLMDGLFACNIQRAGSSGSYTYSVASDWANRPVNLVSWGDAARFSNWLTNGQPTGAQGLTTTEDGSYYLNGAISDAALLAVVRKSPADGGRYYIPTEDEWYKAAYYNPATGTYFDYPTGSNSTPSNDLITPDPGNNANYRPYYNSGDWTIGSPYYRTEVGEFENSESPYGTFDQGGNVWEWNEAVIGSARGWRGGNFWLDSVYLWAATRYSPYSPAYETGHLGFRVSEVPEPIPEPVTLAGMVLGIGGLVGYIRRRMAR